MKTTRLNVTKMILCLFIGFTITLVSCSGEDGKDGINGEMGAQGEQGPQGPQGPAGQDGTNGTNGTDGTDGTDGQDGNANIIVSDWTPIRWDELNQFVPPTSGAMYIDEVTGINDITAFMETGGIVLFYLRRDLGVGYISVLLPYEEGTSRIYADVAISTDPNYILAGLVIHGKSNDVTLFENNNDYMIRYLLVPANVAEASGLADKIPESFGEAAALLGLEQ